MYRNIPVDAFDVHTTERTIQLCFFIIRTTVTLNISLEANPDFVLDLESFAPPLLFQTSDRTGNLTLPVELPTKGIQISILFHFAGLDLSWL